MTAGPKIPTGTLGLSHPHGVQIATGGVAPSAYRKYIASGFLDTYFVDPIPLFENVKGRASWRVPW